MSCVSCDLFYSTQQGKLVHLANVKLFKSTLVLYVVLYQVDFYALMMQRFS